MKDAYKLIRILGIVLIVLGVLSCSNQGLNNPTAPQTAEGSSKWFANLYTTRGTGNLEVWCINAECSGEIQVMTPTAGDYVIGYLIDPDGSRNPACFEDYYLIVRTNESVRHYIGLRTGDIAVAVGIAPTQIPASYPLEQVGWGYFLAPWGMREDQIPQDIYDLAGEVDYFVNSAYEEMF